MTWRLMVAIVVSVAIGIALGVRLGAAQPQLTGRDGFLTGWRVIVQRNHACYSPYVDLKERTITCA